MENKAIGCTVPKGRTPSYEGLRRMALLRLRERLMEDRLTLAELLKVIAGGEEAAAPAMPPGDWVLALCDTDGQGGKGDR